MLDQKYYEMVYNRREPDTATDCDVWTGTVNPHGHGLAFIKHNGLDITINAHRLAYLIYNNLEPDDIVGQSVLHSCRTKRCIREDHLRLGSQSDNMRDMVTDGTHPGQKLSTGDAREIRELYATGSYSLTDLAEAFGVSRSAISKVVNRRTFK